MTFQGILHGLRRASRVNFDLRSAPAAELFGHRNRRFVVHSSVLTPFVAIVSLW
jgi:hypothetical protein